MHAETRSTVSLEIFHTQRGRVGGVREREREKGLEREELMRRDEIGKNKKRVKAKGLKTAATSKRASDTESGKERD